MRGLIEKKPWVLVFSGLSLGALVLLSVSLGGVSFGNAQPIGRQEAPLARPSQASLGQVSEQELYSRIAVWLALAIFFTLIGLLLSKEGRKRLIRFLVRLVLTLAGLYYLLVNYPQVFDFLSPAGGEAAPGLQNLQGGASVPPPVFTPPEESPLLSYSISLFILLGVLFVAWRLYLAWRAMNQASGRTLQELGRIARASLRDLSDGHGSTDVILNCYFRMSEVVAVRRNLQRGLSMTPAEFASRLEQAGLPGDAVRRLTRLFETVRYGGRHAGPKEVNEAVACLTAILQYCGEPT